MGSDPLVLKIKMAALGEEKSQSPTHSNRQQKHQHPIPFFPDVYDMPPYSLGDQRKDWVLTLPGDEFLSVECKL